MEILIYVILYCYLICAVQSLFSYGLNILNEIKETRNYLNGHEYFSENDRLKMKNEVKEMFYFGYDNYMKYAFPLDELNPIYCSGRGPDKERPDNININDVLGGYSLTLIDSLDTLAVFGNNTEFYKAAKLIIQNVSFDQDSTVQVFEATIRVIGGLLAGHLLITDPEQEFGILFPEDEYDGELLNLAHDLANRLLPAFDNSSTGLPWPRVNLRDGVPIDCSTTTCTAGIGTLIVEFGILSFLLQDYTFENVARRAVKSLWKFRSKSTGLFGNVIDITTGEWIGTMSGLGAGIDSFYEYLLKGFILFGESEDLHRFNDLYASVMEHMRKGRVQCNNGSGEPTLFVNVDMNSGKTVNTWIDSLQASFTGVQVLRGDLDEAVCSHALYYKLWQRYGALPERFNWNLKMPDVWFYPLRPEFVESTYLLYQATKHPFYLHVGKEIIKNLNNHTKVKCGFATIHNVLDKTLEDRMESFFLSETLKYLYLLFDFENPLNRDASNWIFSTEGHVFKLNDKYREKAWRDEIHLMQRKDNERFTFMSNRNSSLNWKCDSSAKFKFSKLPLKEEYFRQIDKFIQGSN